MNTAAVERNSVVLDLPIAIFEKLEKIASAEHIKLDSFVTQKRVSQSKYPVSDDVPNEETAAVLEEVMERKNLVYTKATSAKEMLKELLG